MKYGGIIQIIDDQGETAYERELSADEIIDTLIDARKRTLGFEIPKEEVKQTLEDIGNTTPPGGFTPSRHRGELTCAHSIGHGPHVHGCDGCCKDLTVEDGKLVDKRGVLGASTSPKEAKKGCKSCGSKIKRHRKDCPVFGEAAAQPKKQRATSYGCKECDSNGPRHRKGCSLDVKKPPQRTLAEDDEQEAKEDLPEPMPEDHGRVLSHAEYDIVRDLKANTHKTSMQILTELPDDVKLQQVNWAVLLGTYDRYVEHASRAR